MSDFRLDLPDPTSPEARSSGPLPALRQTSPARIATGRAGPRPPLRQMLLFQADHAVTQDALMRQVDPDLLEEMGLFQVASQASNRIEYLKRPDLGRQLSPQAIATLQEELSPQPDVQIFVGDGLSAAAIEHNLPILLPALIIGLQQLGFTIGPPFFVQNARVGLLNAVNQIAKAQICLVLIGERPGLARAESLSIYLGYRPTPDATDAQRNVISNIYQNGLSPQEAAAQAIELIQKMVAQQTSGVSL